MIELKFRIGLDSFEVGDYVYVWLDGERRPFYVGETSKSPIDRAGLHIRDRNRSGAIISEIIQSQKNNVQEYTVLSFLIDRDLLATICKENGATNSKASFNRARKALERAVYDSLSKNFNTLHKARKSKWLAQSGNDFVSEISAILTSNKDFINHE